MKRKVLCCVLAAIFALPALAGAEVNGVYIAPRFLVGIQDSGGVSTDNTSMNGENAFTQHSQAVFGGALAVGYNFAPKFNVPLRTEIEFALRSNSSNKRDGAFREGLADVSWESKMTTNLSTLFFNAYFDINTGTPFTPYLGGGLGMAFKYSSANASFTYPDGGGGFATESVSKSRHDTTFAWNLGAGLSYAFTENVSADLGYRFVHTGYSELTANAPEGNKVKVGSSPYIHEFYLGARFTF